MKKFTVLFYLIFCLACFATAQEKFAKLDKHFNAYQLVSLDSKELKLASNDKSQFIQLVLEVDNKPIEIELWNSGLFSSSFKISYSTNTTNHEKVNMPNALRGRILGVNNSNVRLVVNDHFINGFLEIDEEKYFIQPMRDFDAFAENDQFVIYNEKDAIASEEEATCATHTKTFDENIALESSANHSAMGCFEVEMNLATDWSYFMDKGSNSTGVMNAATAVLNNVQGNYDDEFFDELVYIVNEFWISDCSSCDPWTSSTDAGTLLNSFRSWAPTGFSSAHDVATLWTDRDFDGSTVGVAWVGTICTGSRYNTCQDFTTSAWQLRVLQAHELGHNWSSFHDSGSGFIMSPSVNNSSLWSAQSISSIDSHVASRTCLSSCAPSGSAPSALYSFSSSSPCAPSQVSFTDSSTGATSWSWSFPGGNPSSSTEQNPVVTYANPGVYSSFLTASNGFGSDNYSSTTEIEILDQVVADYFWSASALVTTFTDNSNAESGAQYLWDFGDGNGSIEQNPTHVYQTPGEYFVSLEVQGICGTSIFENIIEIFDVPIASIGTANVNGPCVPFTVDFQDLSYGNIDSYTWSFPGGDPSTSNLPNPSVTYNTPGSYDVFLEVSNPEGTDVISEFGYVYAEEEPFADFNFSIDGATVEFVNTSVAGDTYIWDFGDGYSSGLTNPTHTYISSGVYAVQLETSNQCGTAVINFEVEIILEPTANFSLGGSASGCTDFVVDFMDNSLGNPSSWAWSFPGGNPSSSTEQNPTVVYSTSGIYDVILEVSNSQGTDVFEQSNYIEVNSEPTIFATYSTNLLEVVFDATVTNASSILWEFGDGNTSAAQDPIHVYANEGVYDVLFSATNDCGTVTEAFTVEVIDLPTALFNAQTVEGCAPLTVQYSNLSSTNSSSWTWSFPGGQPATSNEENPTVSYASSGMYDVSLEVSNAAGSDMFSISNYIAVDDVPSVGFTTTTNVLSVEFEATVSNANSISWDFGDGNTSSLEDPTHVYEVEGSYTVVVSATNDCGTVTASKEISLLDVPVANFGVQSNTGCAPFTVIYEDLSSSNTTNWNWSFPGGTPSTSTDQNPTVVYESKGTYDVTLEVSNSLGNDTQTISNYVAVLDVPIADFDFIINGNQIDLQNLTIGATAEWSIEGASSLTGNTASYTFPENGVFEVALTATNECGSDIKTIQVEINAYPSASFEVQDEISGCAPFTVEYFNTSTNTTNSMWSFPGGTPATSSEENPSVVYEAPGVYDVFYTGSNQYGDASTEMLSLITVLDVPSAAFDSAINGSSVDFTSTSVNGEAYRWDFGDGNISTSENPSHSYVEPGTYTITLEVTNECGTSTISEQIVVDFSTPGINASFSETSGCAPFEVQITDMSSNDPISWEWSFPGGVPETSTEQNPSVIYNSSGVYSIEAVISNVDGSSNFTFTDVIIVGDVPLADFSITEVDGTIMLSNQSTNAVSYTWDFGDGNESSEENPTHTFETSGTYTINLEAINECGSTFYSETVEINISSMDDLFTSSEWSVRPNPNNGDFTIAFAQRIDQNLRWEIVDVLGRNISNGLIQSGLKEENILIKSKGTHFLRITNGTESVIRKIIVL